MSLIRLFTARDEPPLLSEVLMALDVEHVSVPPETLLAAASNQPEEDVAIISEEALLAVGSLAGGDWPQVRAALLRFPEILVFPLGKREETSHVLSEILQRKITLRNFERPGGPFAMTPNRSKLGAVAGLSFGSAKPPHDHAIELVADDLVKTLVSVDGGAFMVQVSMGNSEVYLAASSAVFDPGVELQQNLQIADCFTSLAPLLLFLRNSHKLSLWQTPQPFANVILDDPNLRRRYGFVDFPKLAGLVQDLRFAISVGFIPWNASRTSSAISDLFRRTFPRLSICVHGCDHTAGEYSTRTVQEALALTLLAQRRTEMFTKLSGVPCDRVMVFPQGVFSGQAMEALRHTHLIGAVNTELRDCQTGRGVVARELLSPAICSYSGFPLFMRRKPAEPIENFALDQLLGKPCLVVTHHDDYSDGCVSILRLVEALKRMEPALHWTNLEHILTQTYLERTASSQAREVRVFSSETIFSRPTLAGPSLTVRKTEHLKGPFEIFSGGNPIPYKVSGKDLVIGPFVGQDALSVRLPPPPGSAPTQQRFKQRARIAARRYLSEIRDNYVVPAKFTVRSLVR